MKEAGVGEGWRPRRLLDWWFCGGVLVWVWGLDAGMFFREENVVTEVKGIHCQLKVWKYTRLIYFEKNARYM
jgi:hypothetical protein